MKKFFTLLTISALVLMPLMAAAQTSNNPCTLSSVQSGSNSQSSLGACVNQVYIWSLGIGALLALLMVVAGGYFIMTSAGNAESASRGKEMISGAVIGLILLFCAYLILNTINPDLVNFNVDTSGLSAPPANSTTTVPPTGPRSNTPGCTPGTC